MWRENIQYIERGKYKTSKIEGRISEIYREREREKERGRRRERKRERKREGKKER